MNELQLSRFNTYAPFVRKLRLHITPDENEPNWDVVLAAVPNRPLLPGLRTLEWYTKHRQQQEGSKIVACIDPFLCESLLDIRTSAIQFVCLNPLHASQLLQRIAATSRGIQTLQIFINHPVHPENISPPGSYSKSFFAHIGLFHDLRVLRTTTLMLDPGMLQLLGELPRLDSLTVSALTELQRRANTSATDLELTAYSFPALRHLALYDVSSSTISQLWQIPSLVRRLVAIDIKLPLSSGRARSLICELICSICQNSPQTVQLHIDLREIGHVVISSAVVSA
jgi:hypothetical protein